MEKKRCNFSFGTKEYHVSDKFLLYHDTRWCKPEHRDQELYAMLVLEGMQAGVSWNLVLNKEDNFRKAFDGFDPKIVAAYDDSKLEELMQDAGIIRNRQKLKAAITNAQAFLNVQKEFGTFDKYIWSFTNGQVIDHHLLDGKDMPAKDELSERISNLILIAGHVKEYARRLILSLGKSNIWMGAVISMCPAPGMLRENVLELPVWFV